MNVGISTVVEFLQKKGFAVEANPNTKINEKTRENLIPGSHYIMEEFVCKGESE